MQYTSKHYPQVVCGFLKIEVIDTSLHVADANSGPQALSKWSKQQKQLLKPKRKKTKCSSGTQEAVPTIHKKLRALAPNVCVPS
jgi:hypothetical protein